MSIRQIVCATVAVGLVTGGCVTMRQRKAEPALVLAENGRSEFSIVVADDAPPSTRYGAEELQRFLKEMTGAELPIRLDSEPVSAHEIVLGDNAHFRQLISAPGSEASGLSEQDLEALGAEGYVIRTASPHLIIVGGDLRGDLYGVYGLLEDHLGCRWFTPTVSRIPKQSRLVLPRIDETKVPVLEYREPFVRDCFDGDWCARNRVNSSAASLEERHGGKVRFGAGLFVHTFNRLMPPDKYFDEHPEYYSEIDGERVRERTQLCCTNEDVIRICTEELGNCMRQDPEAFVYSLSQNDWDNHCECAECQALADREESQMAPVLHLVNRAAEVLEKEFPDKAIETLAYQWTRKPPKTMRPRPNVIIRLCSIECCFMHPLATCDSEENREFVADLEGWSEVANRLWVWDYVTSFAHYLAPFPNLRVRDDNIRLLVDNNVTGIFEQDVYNTESGELSPLSGYLGAKLLWNPDYDEDEAINEFLEGVYGDAAKPIRKYIDLLHDKVEKDNIHAGIWVGPREVTYLTKAIMAKGEKLWDRAEAAVATEPDVLARVRTARLSFDYAAIERRRGVAGLGECTVDHEQFRAHTNPEYVDLVNRFFEVARASGLTRINEGRISLDQYEAEFERTLAGEELTFEPREPISVGKKARGIAYAVYEGKWQQLPDFQALTPVKTGVTDRFGLHVTGREEDFGIRFEGRLTVPRDGVYTFYTTSNDGSRLWIGPDLVVDSDGLHGLKKMGGFVALRAGTHPIVVEYFQEGGTTGLEVSYEGPGFEEREIQGAVLTHAP